MVFATPIIEVIDGKQIGFPKIFVADYEELFERDRLFKKIKIEKLVKEGLLASDEGKQLKIGMANASENIFDIQGSYAEPKMMRAILEKSWQKTGRPVEELQKMLLEQDPELLARIAFRVTHRDPKPNISEPDPNGARGADGNWTSDSSVGFSGGFSEKTLGDGPSTSGATP